MKKILLLFCLTFVFILSSGCDSKTSAVEEVVFNIDFDQMELPVRDPEMKIGYAIPKGFQELDLSILPKQQISEGANRLQAELKKMYKADSGSMVISFSLLKNTEEEVENILSYPDSLLNPEGYFQNVKVASFRFNNFKEVRQVIQSNADIVNFRMIIKNSVGSLLQVDCLSSPEDYPNNIKLFESFFGYLTIVD